MGFMDKAKDAAQDHPEQVESGVEKGGDFADDKTGGKYTDQIDKGEEQVTDRFGGGDGESASGDSGDAKNETGQNQS